jgi:hypothetical protein
VESESFVSIALDDVSEDSLGQLAHGILHIPSVEASLHGHSLGATVV